MQGSGGIDYKKYFSFVRVGITRKRNFDFMCTPRYRVVNHSLDFSTGTWAGLCTGTGQRKTPRESRSLRQLLPRGAGAIYGKNTQRSPRKFSLQYAVPVKNFLFLARLEFVCPTLFPVQKRPWSCVRPKLEPGILDCRILLSAVAYILRVNIIVENMWGRKIGNNREVVGRGS